MICPPETLDEYLKGREPILDLGCGPGDFLAHLKERGVKASGLELAEQNVMVAQSKGLEVAQGDAFKILAKQKEKYGAIVMSHLIEHFQGSEAARLLALCASSLKKEGLLIILTPNPKNLKVISSLFWEDPTHVRPYGPPALERLVKEAGLKPLRILPLPDPTRGLLWKFRDAVRGALVGPFWGSQELLAVAQKAV